MGVQITTSVHRVYVEDIPVLSDRQYVYVQILEYPDTIRAGHVVCYEPVPSRITTSQMSHSTAELIVCSYDEVQIIPNSALQRSPANRWLVNSMNRYEMILTSFGQSLLKFTMLLIKNFI